MKIGERIYNLERVVINKYGFDGKDDTLPRRLLEEPLKGDRQRDRSLKLTK